MVWTVMGGGKSGNSRARMRRRLGRHLVQNI